MSNQLPVQVFSLGHKTLERAFKALPQKMQKNTMRQAATFALTPCLKAAKAEAPERTGALKESLTKVVRGYAKDGLVIGLIGVEEGFYRAYPIPPGDKHGPSRTGQQWPENYLHLVLWGTYDSEGDPFLQRAHKRTRNEMVARFRRKASKVILKDARKARQAAGG